MHITYTLRITLYFKCSMSFLKSLTVLYNSSQHSKHDNFFENVSHTIIFKITKYSNWHTV